MRKLGFEFENRWYARRERNLRPRFRDLTLVLTGKRYLRDKSTNQQDNPFNMGTFSNFRKVSPKMYCIQKVNRTTSSMLRFKAFLVRIINLRMRMAGFPKSYTEVDNCEQGGQQNIV